MSTSTRPGSWRARGLRSPASASSSWAVSVVRSATSASSRDPACDTTPSPSAVAVILGRVVVACTSKVPLYQVDLRPQQAQFPLVARHFRLSRHGHADRLMKSRVSTRPDRLSLSRCSASPAGIAIALVGRTGPFSRDRARRRGLPSALPSRCPSPANPIRSSRSGSAPSRRPGTARPLGSSAQTARPPPHVHRLSGNSRRGRAVLLQSASLASVPRCRGAPAQPVVIRCQSPLS